MNWHRHRFGDGNGERGDSLTVSFGFRVLQVQRAAECLERVVVGLLQFVMLGTQLRGALFDFAFQVLLVVPVLYNQTTMLQRPSHSMKQLVLFEGLQDVIVSPAPDRNYAASPAA